MPQVPLESAGPNTSPPLPARQACTGNGCAGRQTRGQTPPTPHPPLPCRSQTCHLPGCHPPSLQAHLLSGQSPEPLHQSHTTDGTPTLSWALPTAPDKSVLSRLLRASPRCPRAVRSLSRQVLPAFHGLASGPNSTTPLSSNKSNYSHCIFRPFSSSTCSQRTIPFFQVCHMYCFLQEVFPDPLPPRPQTSPYLLSQAGVLDPCLKPQPLWATFTWQQ